MAKSSYELKIEYESFLNTLGIASLRSLAREIGVDKPTKCKTKSTLIELIVGVLLGEIAPVGKSNRGAPVKAEAVNPKILLRLREIDGNALDEVLKNQEYVVHIDEEIEKAQATKNVISVNAPKSNENFMECVFIGQIIKKGNYFSLYLLNGAQVEFPIMMDFETIAEYRLKEGDIISCYLNKKEGFYKVSKIFMVNEVLVPEYKRQDVDSAEISFERQSLPLPSNKFISWFLPIIKGCNNLIVAPSKAGKSTLLNDICVGLKSNSNFKTFALLLEQPRENIFRFQQILSSNELLYTTYDQDVDEHVFVAELMLNRAKAYAETGKDVVLLVDDLLALAKAYDENSALDGKMVASGLTSKSIRYIKKILSSAINFKGNGSLTLVCATPIETGNPDDDLFFAEISALFETIIRLDGNLARKRIFPAIDFKASVSNFNTFKEDVFEKIKGIDNETIISYAQSSESYEEFVSKIK